MSAESTIKQALSAHEKAVFEEDVRESASDVSADVADKDLADRLFGADERE